jgi:hypothetical protein
MVGRPLIRSYQIWVCLFVCTGPISYYVSITCKEMRCKCGRLASEASGRVALDICQNIFLRKNQIDMYHDR